MAFKPLIVTSRIQARDRSIGTFLHELFIARNSSEKGPRLGSLIKDFAPWSLFVIFRRTFCNAQGNILAPRDGCLRCLDRDLLPRVDILWSSKDYL